MDIGDLRSNIDDELLKAWDARLAAAEAKMESNTLVGGTKIRTHSRGECAGYWCCIHNPSPHHMRAWEQYWDDTDLVMHRICQHGEMHPDPDDPNEFRAAKYHKGNCCGCCIATNHIKRRNP